jgi:hypothetical protein
MVGFSVSPRAIHRFAKRRIRARGQTSFYRGRLIWSAGRLTIRRMSFRRALRGLPFLLPPLALALAVWLQPADHMGPYPDRAPWLGRAVYDDWDSSALVLRGLNASLGRKPGLTAEPRLPLDEFAAALNDPDRPLADRYYLEYPPAATWLFRLPFLFRPLQPPAALCDGPYGDVLFHQPRDDAERDLWRALRRAAQSYAALMVVCLLLLMALVRRGYEPGGGLSGPAWLLALPGALYFTLNRFDALPALLTALSLACLGRRWLIASAAFLAAGTMVKVYPVLLAPLVVRYLWPDRRAALTWAAAFAAAAAALLLPSLLAHDWQAVAGPLRVQLSREPLGPTLYAWLPQELAANDGLGRGFRFGTLALVLLALCSTRPPELASVLRRGAVALIVFTALQVFYSPQWILWLSPLLVPLAGRGRLLAALVAGLDLTTYLSFAVFMDYGYARWPDALDLPAPLGRLWEEMGGALLAARFPLLGAIVSALVWAELRRARVAPSAAVGPATQGESA